MVWLDHKLIFRGYKPLVVEHNSNGDASSPYDLTKEIKDNFNCAISVTKDTIIVFAHQNGLLKMLKFSYLYCFEKCIYECMPIYMICCAIKTSQSL